MAVTDLSTTDTVAVILGATIYAAAQWIRYRLNHRPPNLDQAQAWAEGFRAGTQAAATGYPVPNPYAGEPDAPPDLDVRHDA